MAYEPPRDHRESLDLLKKAEQWEQWKRNFWPNLLAVSGEFLTIAFVLAVVAAVVLALWLGSLLIGATAAGIIGLIAVMIWLGRKE